MFVVRNVGLLWRRDKVDWSGRPGPNGRAKLEGYLRGQPDFTVDFRDQIGIYLLIDDRFDDRINSSRAPDLVGMNIEIASLFAREWLGRAVTAVRSTTLYRGHQALARAMLRQVQEAALPCDSDVVKGLDRTPRWDWWLLRSDGRRQRPDLAPGPVKRRVIGGIQLLFGSDLAALDKAGVDDLVIPGVLADTVGDLFVRKLAYATQYWRSQSTIAIAHHISTCLWGHAPRSHLIGDAGSFIVPPVPPPRWLSPIEMQGFRSGIYSVVLYWLIGLKSAPPRAVAASHL